MTTIGRSLFRTAHFSCTGAEAVGARNERNSGNNNERATPTEKHSRLQTSRYSERSQDTALGSAQHFGLRNPPGASVDKAVRELQHFALNGLQPNEKPKPICPCHTGSRSNCKPQALRDTAPPVNEPRSEAPVSPSNIRAAACAIRTESLRMRQPCQNELNDRTPSSGRIRSECPGGSF
jgi:hypothetical protein